MRGPSTEGQQQRANAAQLTRDVVLPSSPTRRTSSGRAPALLLNPTSPSSSSSSAHRLVCFQELLLATLTLLPASVPLFCFPSIIMEELAPPRPRVRVHPGLLLQQSSSLYHLSPLEYSVSLTYKYAVISILVKILFDSHFTLSPFGYHPISFLPVTTKCLKKIVLISCFFLYPFQSVVCSPSSLPCLLSSFSQFPPSLLDTLLNLFQSGFRISHPILHHTVLVRVH